MNIVNAERHLQYIDPHQYVRKHVLPITTECATCDAELVIDSVYDLWAERWGNRRPRLAFRCPICCKVTMLGMTVDDGVMRFYLKEEPLLRRWMTESEDSAAFISALLSVWGILGIIVGIVALVSSKAWAEGWSLIFLTSIPIIVYNLLSSRVRQRIRRRVRRQ